MFFILLKKKEIYLSDNIVEYIIYLGGNVINNDNKGGD